MLPESWLMLREGIAFAAALATIYAFFADTMIPLRTAAIVANVLFMAYGAVTGAWTIFVLHALLMPLNVGRLIGMRKLIDDARRASESDLNAGWLRSYMKNVSFPAGAVLFRKGERADSAYYIEEGEVEIVEIGVTLGAGNLFGEMGMFTEGQTRTMTVRCRTAVRAQRMTYDDFRVLYFQNPQFGFYLLRLLVQRMQRSNELAVGSSGTPAPTVGRELK